MGVARAMKIMLKLLLVQADPAHVEALTLSLMGEGFTVIATSDGAQALALVHREQPNVCVFDLRASQPDGLSLCRLLRQQTATPPPILLTATSAEIEQFASQETCADDYVIKPFSVSELVTRMQGVLLRHMRRSTAQARVQQDPLRSGHVTLSLISRRVYVSNIEVKLSQKEFNLLATLMCHRGVVLSRQFLITQVWGDDFVGATRTVDVHVRWLREKLEHDPSRPVVLQTVRGVGYRMD
jgi:DNA-binding response OmpR family regulator